MCINKKIDFINVGFETNKPAKDFCKAKNAKNLFCKIEKIKKIEKLVGRSKKLIQIKQNLKLTLLQKKILPGILLGDAHLSTQNNGKTYRLHIYQSNKHKEYVFHLYDIFKEWCLSKPKVIERLYKSGVYKGKKATMISFKTVSSASFRFYAHNFVNKNIGVIDAVNEKNTKLTKKVPKLIHRWLTPISLAYWYMDDGSIKDKKSKAVYLNTQGFEFTEVKTLCEILNSKFNLLSKPVKKKDKYQIYISGKSYKILKNLIYPFLLKEMLYKFPD